MSQMPDSPWWQEVQRLEQAGDWRGADAVITSMLGAGERRSPYALGEFYQARMRRSLAAGDVEIAEAAYKQAKHWYEMISAGATSGGEGMALVEEAAEITGRLRMEFVRGSAKLRKPH